MKYCVEVAHIYESDFFGNVSEDEAESQRRMERLAELKAAEIEEYSTWADAWTEYDTLARATVDLFEHSESAQYGHFRYDPAKWGSTWHLLTDYPQLSKVDGWHVAYGRINAH